MDIWGGIEALKEFTPVAIAEREGDAKLLTGPKARRRRRPRLAGRHRRTVN